MQVEATVDAGMRKRSKCNHTATHLLQAALKQVLPNDVAQQGSAVTFDSLRFDFNLDRPMKVPSTLPPQACNPLPIGCMLLSSHVLPSLTDPKRLRIHGL